MRMSSSRKAFTLVEIIIAVAIGAMVIVMVMFFFRRTLSSFYQGQMKYIADSDAQVLIETLKRDLSMSCKLETVGDYLVEPIFNYEESGSEHTWSFYRFHEYVDGVPKARKVSYTWDSDKNIVAREYEGSRSNDWEGVVFFKLHYYGLLPIHRYFYNIQIELETGKEGASTKKERLRLTTSVESKYENHLVNFPGWLKNTDSAITE